MLEVTCPAKQDLPDTPIDDPDDTRFTDSSSFILNGVRLSGYAAVRLTEVTESGPLPWGSTSAPKAEFRALQLGADRRLNLYTDSSYAFHVVHAHAAMWRERGLLTAQNTPIKHTPEIVALQEAVVLPRRVAIIHCQAHQKGHGEIPQGNRADKQARGAAKLPTQAALVQPLHLSLHITPRKKSKRQQGQASSLPQKDGLKTG